MLLVFFWSLNGLSMMNPSSTCASEYFLNKRISQVAFHIFWPVIRETRCTTSPQTLSRWSKELLKIPWPTQKSKAKNYVLSIFFLWISFWISFGQFVQKEISSIMRKTYPESILFWYKEFQRPYLFSKKLISNENKDLSTKITNVNYYYYLYI